VIISHLNAVIACCIAAVVRSSSVVGEDLVQSDELMGWLAGWLTRLLS